MQGLQFKTIQNNKLISFLLSLHSFHIKIYRFR